MTRDRTAGAGVYPWALVEKWAEAVTTAAPAGARGEAQAEVLDFVETQLLTAAETRTGHHSGPEWPGDPKHVGAADHYTSRSGQRPLSSRTRTGDIPEASHYGDRGLRPGEESGSSAQPDCAIDPAADKRRDSDCLDPAYAGAAASIRRGIIFGQHSNLEADAIRRRWARGTECSDALGRSDH